MAMSRQGSAPFTLPNGGVAHNAPALACFSLALLCTPAASFASGALLDVNGGAVVA